MSRSAGDRGDAAHGRCRRCREYERAFATSLRIALRGACVHSIRYNRSRRFERRARNVIHRRGRTDQTQRGYRRRPGKMGDAGRGSHRAYRRACRRLSATPLLLRSCAANCRTRAHLAWIPSSCASALILHTVSATDQCWRAHRLHRHARAGGSESAAPGDGLAADLQGTARRAPRPGGALARGWTSRGFIRYSGGGGADRPAGAHRLWRLVKQMLAVSLHKAETRADWSVVR